VVSDAETVAAAEKFEPLLRRYLTVHFEWAHLSRAARAEAFEKFGDDYGADGWSKPLPGKSPGTAFLSEVQERNGCHRASAMEKALSEEMEPFAEKIREADVTTTAGLRAKALVAVWDIRVGRLTHSEGVAFILESGHQITPRSSKFSTTCGA
jgi:hypothetical protein